MLNFMKICPVRAEWLHSNRQKDERTDMTKLIIVFFFNFSNGRKKEQIHFLNPPNRKYNGDTH